MSELLDGDAPPRLVAVATDELVETLNPPHTVKTFLSGAASPAGQRRHLAVGNIPEQLVDAARPPGAADDEEVAVGAEIRVWVVLHQQALPIPRGGFRKTVYSLSFSAYRFDSGRL
ncbi:hypothetical protein AB0N07_24150 [Streptomyces sp. NPDC051172]|uniref:hypothetical protein n=1 Tax=Streptomyces sp. NPDC051172 TaxID=3155796 RepID=UPI00342E4268